MKAGSRTDCKTLLAFILLQHLLFLRLSGIHLTPYLPSCPPIRAPSLPRRDQDLPRRRSSSNSSVHTANTPMQTSIDCGSTP
ncbi:hypothetical protein AB205_0022770 [Aquarana catesbeiana]|uniref:Secreted protein n=1 Tax=Aquarana catesbeiana TaxID=8400 RepID=A0A2G9SG89_AQUCT|nr:hypothetical protein AB205_0022770 [Aquarana catesbeiana]